MRKRSLFVLLGLIALFIIPYRQTVRASEGAAEAGKSVLGGGQNPGLLMKGWGYVLPAVLQDAPPPAAWQLEVGQFDTNDTYRDPTYNSVQFQQSFSSTPLVFPLITNWGDNPATLHFRNIDTTGFEATVMETPAEDGPHYGLNVHYIAVSPGEHVLPDGTPFIAGTVETTAVQCHVGIPGCTQTSWEHITLPDGVFQTPPVILVAIQSHNNEPLWGDPKIAGSLCTNAAEKEPPQCSSTPWLTAVAANITTTGFDVALERSESLAGEVNESEVIAYLAIPDQALGALLADTDADGVPDDEVLYEFQEAGGIKGWSNGGGTVTFLRTYTDPPLAVASKDSRYGGDGGWLRRDRNTPTTTSIRLFVDEDRDYDSERAHVEENVGLAVFSQAFHADFQVVEGHVYEDPQGTADTGSFVPRPDVSVSLYLDDGDGIPNAADTFVRSTTTDADGAYAFLVTSGGTYWVVVDSKTVTPSAGYNAGFDQDDVWAEQTYGPAGGLCANPDGLLGAADDPYERTDAGSCYGGKDGAVSDDASALSSAEHIAKVPVNGADVSALDFAFSFNVVTNINDQDDDTTANRTSQGTLRQFIQNANAVAGANTMRFVPAVSTNANNGGNAWWSIYVQDLDSAVTDELTITDTDTTVDGTAYSYADGTTERDTNPAEVTAPEPVGISQTTLPTFYGPELEIANANIGSNGFAVDADDVTIRRMAIYHMRSGAAVYVKQDRQNVLVEENFLSARADGSDPGWFNSAKYGINTDTNGGMTVDVRHNYVAYSSNSGINDFGAGDIFQNLIEHIGSNEPCSDGVTIHYGSTADIAQNYIQDIAAYAVDGFDAWGQYTIEENTFTQTGQGDRNGTYCPSRDTSPDLNEDELGGIRAGGSDALVEKNIIHDTPGHGAVVFGRRITFTQNAFYNNAGISIDLFKQVLGSSNGDGVTPNDGAEDTYWGNFKQDYPIFTKAELNGSQLTVEGFVGTPTSTLYDGQQMTIEIYKADDDGNNNGEVIVGDGLDEPHGEGHWYLGTCTPTLGTNGTFTCTISVPASVSLATGDPITATATDADGNTSEFGSNLPIAEADLAVTKDDGVVLISPGTTLTYTIVVTNNGPNAITGAVVSDAKPAEIASWTWVCDSTTGGASGCDGVTNSTADFSDTVDLPIGSSITYKVTAQVSDTASGTLENKVEVALPTGFEDPDPDNNSATDTDSIAEAGKSVAETNQDFTTDDDVAIGEILTYETTLSIPPGQTVNLTLTDVMDRGLAFVACDSITASGTLTSTAGSLDDICASPTVSEEPAGSTAAEDQGRKVVWDFGTVTNATGDDVTLTVRYQVVVLNNEGNQSGTALANEATWTWDSGEAQASADPVSVLEPDLTIDKSASPTTVLPGEPITFTLEIQHTADSETPAYDVEISDVLPSGLNYVSGSLTAVDGPTPTSMNYDAATRTIQVTWDTFDLGEVSHIRFQATASSAVSGELTNTASVAWSSLPGDVSDPQSQYNNLSTERYYDPNSPVNVYQTEASVQIRVLLPETGFAPGRVTLVPEQQVAYQGTAIVLEIPKLGVEVPVVGVPRSEEGWDLTWLWDQAGWLEGSAYPTWPGNTVITGHVYLPDGEPGPFVDLRKLMWGDKIILHANGERYEYEVRVVQVVRPDDARLLGHKDRDWVTLVTCQGYDEQSGTYRWRLIVQAVLVKVAPEG